MERNAAFLVVDDDPDMCWILQCLLEKHGFSSQSARDGQRALELVSSRRFPLIFLDMKLPDMDGLDLARLILAIDSTARIVIVSGYFYAHDPIVRKALDEGLICSFIGKPFHHQEIVAIVQQLLGN